jgi:hypothetical protein
MVPLIGLNNRKNISRLVKDPIEEGSEPLASYGNAK